MSRKKEASRVSLAKTGSMLGSHLTVLGLIDGGGCEPVYIVWNHKSWCPMACKVMQSYENAQHEAEVLREFAHPNIVRVFEVLLPGYLLMPFLEGPLLSSMIDHAPKRRLTISNALRVAIHMGAAINHVHARGFLHLDVKPDNVIVAAGGHPVLFDFGTARRIGAPRPQKVIGTNSYIAPEECLLGNTGPSADVFSLGVTLYEMLTGEIPFGKGTAKAPFPQLKLDPKPLRDYRPSSPRALENLIFACLERSPEFRPELFELLPALNNMIESGPRMWPEGFKPERPGEKQRARRATASFRNGNTYAGNGSPN